jgi:hypothetical protein
LTARHGLRWQYFPACSTGGRDWSWALRSSDHKIQIIEHVEGVTACTISLTYKVNQAMHRLTRSSIILGLRTEAARVLDNDGLIFTTTVPNPKYHPRYNEHLNICSTWFITQSPLYSSLRILFTLLCIHSLLFFACNPFPFHVLTPVSHFNIKPNRG